MDMKNKYVVKMLVCSSLLFLTGCGTRAQQEGDHTIPATQETEHEDENSSLLDAFLTDEIPAFYDDGTESVMRSDLEYEDYETYSVGERTDLDNDGENELILNGPYGGIYFDVRDGKVYILAQGEGTADWLSYTYYDHAVWIVHSDTTHVGRQMYWLTKYDGDGNVTDEFQFGAEYWDAPDDRYDESSVFTYRDEKISMTEYEALRKEIIGY